jgi:hypothetical protein
MVAQNIRVRGQHENILLVTQGNDSFRVAARGSAAGEDALGQFL